MLARIVIVVLAAALLGTATVAAWRGTGGQSSSIISTRTGSPGGGYGFSGSVK